MPAAQYRNRSTPGVYVTEIPAFPPSVVGVPTAIPIFVGYTEKAEVGGRSALLRPVQIGSVADFEQIYGTGYTATYTLKKVDAAGPYDFRVMDTDSSEWVGYQLVPASTPPSGGAAANPAGAPAAAPSPAPAGGAEGGAATQETAPLLPRFNLYNSIRLFYANGGSTCYVVSVGPYGEAGVARDDLVAGLDAAGEQVGPTMIVVPDAVLLPPNGGDANPWESDDFRDVAQRMMGQASRLQDRIALLDVYGAQYTNTADHSGADLETVITRFRGDVGDNDGGNGETYLSYGAAYFPFLDTTVIPLSDVSYLSIDRSDGVLGQILRSENSRLNGTATAAGSAAGGAAATEATAGPGAPGGTAAKTATGSGKAASTGPGAAPAAGTGTGGGSGRYATVGQMIDDMDHHTDPSDPDVARLNKHLVAALPVLKTIEQRVIAHTNVLPPSAAMAGVYTSVDAESGVWNAPANVSLAAVDAPTLNVNGDQQADLNLPVDGKAVNALRAFPGRGTVVWGARTLDGNSPDYRYVQVRRTLIYLEQSIKAALEPFVFAPNTGQTWATVTSMVSGFLTGVWTRGGLMGAKASDAFTVACGLGSTMTADDVLNGYMIVQVTLNLIHPAEFIELTFKQTMQSAG